MKCIAMRKPRAGKHRHLRAIALLVTATVALPIASAPSAGAETARATGWHAVCADNLTMYNGVYVATFTWYDSFNIDHFAGDGHVWGIGYHGGISHSGWVYNGWFCP